MKNSALSILRFAVWDYAECLLAHARNVSPAQPEKKSSYITSFLSICVLSLRLNAPCNNQIQPAAGARDMLGNCCMMHELNARFVNNVKSACEISAIVKCSTESFRNQSCRWFTPFNKLKFNSSVSRWLLEPQWVRSSLSFVQCF